ncbi:hypothetical protein EBAPG3_001715 [Nitrosospira lacus]|uniref:DUF2971 domain-containing protein n=1 Tax=Nitrosospira lacus TaxID=1288494 RepID=A0A1W6SLC8_9PROT|nr:DUF2971 domain-containing protein [Nitrosospira lacus]ARO86599.1 hypothetical protein EBAPG3_001715 [Nitrosospira lacus]
MQLKSRELAPYEALPAEVERTLHSLNTLSPIQARQYLKGPPNRLPYFVYRYLSPEIPQLFLADYLVDSYFYLSPASAFNDPFDTGAHITVSENVKKLTSKYKKEISVHMPGANWKQRERKLRELMFQSSAKRLSDTRAAFEKNLDDAGVICFSDKARDLLMWSHYASHHRGLAIQFHIINDVRTMTRLSPVDYSKDYVSIDWTDYTHEQLGVAFLRKHEGWKYEEERRIFVVDGARKYLKFRPQLVTGLIFGCRADLGLKKKVMEVLTQRSSQKLPPIKIYQATKHQKEYRIRLGRDRSMDWPT